MKDNHDSERENISLCVCSISGERESAARNAVEGRGEERRGSGLRDRRRKGGQKRRRRRCLQTLALRALISYKLADWNIYSLSR